MRKYTFMVLAIISYSLITGCNTPRYIYSSSKLNHAYLKKKGEGKISGYYSSANNNSAREMSEGVDFQAAYAMSDHWLLNASFFHRNEADKYMTSRDEKTIRYKRNLTEFGSGYYLSLNTTESIFLSFTAGIAFGRFDINEGGYVAGSPTSAGYFHNASVTKPYFQTAFNFFAVPSIRFAVILRPSFVKYGNVKTNYSEEQLWTYRIHVAGRTVGMFESELNMQLNHPKIPWLNLEIALCNASPFRNDYYAVRQNNVSVGLVFARRKARPASESKSFPNH